MTRKPALRASELHLQSIAEEHAALIARVAALIGTFERRNLPLTAGQSRQLNHALDCIADGLFSLAACELEDFVPRRRHIDFASGNFRQMAASASGESETKADSPQETPISLAALRRKLKQVNDARRSAAKQAAPKKTTSRTGRLPAHHLTTT